jgi:hypothetical protein
VPGALELTDEARERIREMEDLSRRVQDGEEDLRPVLRRMVKESAPEVIARCSDSARIYRRMVAAKASGGSPLAEEAIAEGAERLALELAGENPTPLEVLLSERIASLWVLVEFQEALLFAWYGGNSGKTSPAFLLLQMCKIQESVNRRYLQSVKMLAQVRRLQAKTPPLHLTQINVS